MNINIQNLAKRIFPTLCVLLILLTIVMPAIPAQAATDSIIGTWVVNNSSRVLLSAVDVRISAEGTFYYKSTSSVTLAEKSIVAIGSATSGRYDYCKTFTLWADVNNGTGFCPDGQFASTSDNYSGFASHAYTTYPDLAIFTITNADTSDADYPAILEWLNTYATKQVEETAIIEAGTYRFNDVLDFTGFVDQSITFFCKPRFYLTDSGLLEMSADDYSEWSAMSYGYDATGGDTLLFESVELKQAFPIYFQADTEIDTKWIGAYICAVAFTSNSLPELIGVGQTIEIRKDTDVSAEFAVWFAANTSKVGNYPSTVKEISVTIKDSSGNVLKIGSGSGHGTVTVQSNGLAVTFSDGSTFTYTYEGVGYFAGVRVDSPTGSLIKPGEELGLIGDVSLYVEVGQAVEIRDAETNELLGVSQGQLPVSIGMNGTEIFLYYSNRTVVNQSIAIAKGLQFAGWSTSLIYAKPQYDLGEVVDFNGRAVIYVHWAEASIRDPAPELPLGPDQPVDTPDWIDPGLNDVYEDIFHQKEDISSAIDKIGNIGAGVNLDKYNFDMEVFIGSAFPNVSSMLTSIVDVGFMPQILTSLGLAILIAVILFGSDR